MNGERAQVNGLHSLNGATSTQHHQATEAKIARSTVASGTRPLKTQQAETHVNGVHLQGPEPVKTEQVSNGVDTPPAEVLDLVSKEFYLPLAKIINRRTQATWGGLSKVIDRLAEYDVPFQHGAPGAPINNTSKANLDKKEAVLEFLREEKDDLIKLLVLLQWSHNSDRVARIISLSQWISRRRAAYWGATAALATLKRDAVGFQIPNADIDTAGEVLSSGKVASFPDLGYKKTQPMSNKQILAVLRRLNRALSLRLCLSSELPPQFRQYSVHDGRVTFTVQNEFEVDVSVLDESPQASFQVVDFRFAFRPRPALPDYLRGEIERLGNERLGAEGLDGCYQFLHELTLSNKVIEFHRQALELANGQWRSHLKVELHHRNLAVQYWPERPGKQSWLEIGVNKPSLDTPSHIALRWFREGVAVKDFNIETNLAHLSLESLLSQVTAQHSASVLDTLFDQTIAAPIFNTQGLSVDLSVSESVSEDCILQIQMSEAQTVDVSIDERTGNFSVGPASEFASRLQFELNRSKTIMDDFVPRVLNHRCTVAEALILQAVSSTSWTRLPAFRPPSADIRSVIPATFSRVNFFRHRVWSKEFLMAISHGLDGDQMWILRQTVRGRSVVFAGSKVIHNELLPLEKAPSREAFEKLAEYSSRLIVISAAAREIRDRQWKCHFGPTSESTDKKISRLIAFAIGKGDEKTTPAAHQRPVQIDFVQLDSRTESVGLTATVRVDANADVLSQLSASNPDSNVQFVPQEGLVIINLSAPAGTPIVDKIVSHISRVQELTACIQTVQRLKSMRLQAISMGTMTIAYQQGGRDDLRMTVKFPTSGAAASIDFSPKDSNPEVRLAASLSRMLNRSSGSFATRLEDAISCLTFNRPLLEAICHLEQSLQPGPEDDVDGSAGRIQVHVLVRQPVMFALQFFKRSPNGSPATSNQERLLARFEVLPQTRGNKVWMLRPALERINEYSKPSFASLALQAKVKSEIFSKDTEDWMPLDVAAAFLVAKPKPLLMAIRQVMVDWVKLTDQPNETKPKVEPAVKAPTVLTQAPARPGVQPSQGTQAPANNRAPNRSGPPRAPNQPAASMQQQRQRPASGQNKPNPNASKSNDVITID